MNRQGESNALHARVQAFARSGDGNFEELALRIADYQRRYSPGMARLVERHKSQLDTLAAIPAVPSSAFRLGRVATHGATEDVAGFVTSGTTETARGHHYFRTLETYRCLALAFGRQALLPRGVARGVFAALAPNPSDRNRSSLGFMMSLFIGHLDGPEPGSKAFEERWLLRDGRLLLEGLERLANTARSSRVPLVLLTTSFALSELVHGLRQRPLEFPEATIIMETGGFKGKSGPISEQELRPATVDALGIDEAQIVDEYGMTELSSQLYTATLPGGALRARAGVYLEPPWLRVVPVDPISLEPVADGEVGIARILDLGNVDSAVAILTEDRVRRSDGGIELLGRLPNAPARGCSLASEALFRRGQAPHGPTFVG